MTRKSKVRTVRRGCGDGVKHARRSQTLVKNVPRVVNRARRSLKSAGRHRVPRRTKRRTFRKLMRCAKGGATSLRQSEKDDIVESDVGPELKLFEEHISKMSTNTNTQLDVSSQMLKANMLMKASMLSTITTKLSHLKRLDASNNSLGELALPYGWSIMNRGYTDQQYIHVDGTKQTDAPEGSLKGVNALANAIRNIGALETLNILNNDVGETGAKLLEDAWKSRTTLKTICGASEELDLARKLGTNLPVVIVELKNNDALMKLDISDNFLRLEGTETLAEALTGNKVMTELNISNNHMTFTPAGTGQMAGVNAIADAIPTMGALTSLNVSNNNLGEMVLPSGWEQTAFSTDPSRNVFKHTDGRKVHGSYPSGSEPRGAVVLANAIKNNGALVKFDISNNRLSAEGGKALAGALKDNQVMTELNIAENRLGFKAEEDYEQADMSGVVAISDAIPTMGALVKFDISDNDLYEEGIKTLAEALTGNKVMTELNISKNGMTYALGKGFGQMAGVNAIADAIPTMGALTNLDVSSNNIGELVLPEGWTKDIKADYSGYEYKHTDGRKQENMPEGATPDGAIALADAIKNNGALSSVNILKNNIEEHGCQAMEAALKQSNTLKSICGARGTALDLSRFQRLSAEDAKVVAIELKNNRALDKLLMDVNSFNGIEAGKALGNAIAVNTVLKDLEISRSKFNTAQYDAEFIKGFFPGLSANGSLVTVSIMDNCIPTDEMKTLILIAKSPSLKIHCKLVAYGVMSKMSKTPDTLRVANYYNRWQDRLCILDKSKNTLDYYKPKNTLSFYQRHRELSHAGTLSLDKLITWTQTSYTEPPLIHLRFGQRATRQTDNKPTSDVSAISQPSATTTGNYSVYNKNITFGGLNGTTCMAIKSTSDLASFFNNCMTGDMIEYSLDEQANSDDYDLLAPGVYFVERIPAAGKAGASKDNNNTVQFAFHSSRTDAMNNAVNMRKSLNIYQTNHNNHKFCLLQRMEGNLTTYTFKKKYDKQNSDIFDQLSQHLDTCDGKRKVSSTSDDEQRTIEADATLKLKSRR